MNGPSTSAQDEIKALTSEAAARADATAEFVRNARQMLHLVQQETILLEQALDSFRRRVAAASETVWRAQGEVTGRENAVLAREDRATMRERELDKDQR